MTTPPPVPPVAMPPVAAPRPPAPRPLPADATVGGLAFHRLLFARRRSGWWTPLVVGALGVAIYFAFLVVIFVGILIATLASPAAGEWLLTIGTDVSFDLADPAMLVLLLGSIVLMLPAYVLASLIVNGRRLGLISSAAGRLRWGWMLLCTAAAAVVALVLTALSALLPTDEVVDTTGTIMQPAENPMFLWSLLIILLIVPLQCAAEEYVFRGYLQQAIGRWLRHPLFAILLPVPLFVLGHLYDPLGQLSVGVFAVVAGWLTWRTGGLEAAIALHVVNNLLAFLLALFGLGDINATSPGVTSFVWSTVVVLAYAGGVEWLFRRRALGRTLVLTPVAPQANPVPAPVHPG
ncbi:CPBP family intramembrane glutamic endopeptidase [Microbacterium invictum]|uniref:Membrane protease YdiL (CAAX protease family) n=1 Tax=Microbacterium invictum TaxID=515415 RepID=A0AA40SLM2_9MICO|nr:CPBP family intramembrane glutamic endopeptidase [Microbacterium invictum]MBB4138505.1 membrane protease YdiL (CAAX protease family) [Microbacterium invictum]